MLSQSELACELPFSGRYYTCTEHIENLGLLKFRELSSTQNPGYVLLHDL